ncbi:hypothetical protein UFOVP464_10 [uncultured Caudovirales phage]|uniref:Uncharacterized protein n=1 Tax=uncultured Caudovirales phage TaxID=2100421 RepID=A0A6J5MFP1_9CAUD|nr:hypothetical protein UFOVP464_10 [uncultured Caudovirales phage]CAB4189241.1 hypothetical protein UFOVP1189_25 [uncultured Caudovirales phage]
MAQTDSNMTTKVRSLTGADGNVFTDSEIVVFLSAHATDYVRAPMTGVSEDGTVYTKFYANVSDWEDRGAGGDENGYIAVTFRDSENNIVPLLLFDGEETPVDVFDFYRGVLTFATGRSSNWLSITGTAYDINAVCADVLNAWAAKVSSEYDVSLDGNTYNRSSQAETLRAAAAAFTRRANTRVGTSERGDERWV